MAVQSRLKVLILQHPQEPDKALGTARLIVAQLPNARLEVALSRSSLAHALGMPKGSRVDPKRWAVLYLGSGIKSTPGPECVTRPLVFVDSKGNPVGRPPAAKDLDGLVVLDGTWSQAKALWWRNAWLLKLWRVTLQAGEPSLYGKRRKEPRRECVSTLEATARALVALGEDSALQTQLLERFTELLGVDKKSTSNAQPKVLPN